MADESCQTPTNYFRTAVGIIFILGAFIIFFLVLTGRTSLDWKDVALMVVGALIAKLGTIVDWTFGSSQSSDHKTDILADTAKAAAVSSTDSARVLAASEVKENQGGS